MAKPVAFHTPHRNGHDALHARVERASQEHAEAILAAYEVLQLLHDRGVLAILQAGLAAGDQLLDIAVESVDSPTAIRAARNLLFWQRVMGDVEPDSLQGIFKAVPDGLAMVAAEREQKVSLWRVMRRALSKDSLRGLAAAVDLLESFGRRLRTIEHRDAVK